MTHDAGRLRALADTELMDSAPDEAFDRLTRIATRMVGAPIALVSLVDGERQWFKSAVGLPEGVTQTPLSHSFCRLVVESGEPFTVDDAREHPLVCDNPGVAELGMVAYAGVPLLHPDGHTLGAICAIDPQPRPWSDEDVGVLRDLAAVATGQIALHRAARSAHEADTRFRDVVAHAPMIVFALDAEGRFEMMEGSRVVEMGLAGDVMVGQSVFDLGHPQIAANCRRAMAGETFRDVIVIKDLVFDTYYRPGPDGGVIGVSTDVTERHRSERRAEFLAYRDPLTGLANRAGFEVECADTLARARTSGNAAALLAIDLDDFKLVNDSLGHAAGDTLLQLVVTRFSEVLRTGDLLARQGGDELVLLLQDIEIDPRAAAQAAAARILSVLEEPFSVLGEEFTVGASVGIALYPRHGEYAAELLKRADVALYEAKGAGGSTSRVYDVKADDTRRRLTLTARLRGAMADDQLVLHHQPIVRLDTGKIVGLESLLRWQDPERGLVPPGDFLPHAEESGLIDELGLWVVGAVCDFQGRLSALGLHPKIGFNVAPRQLRQADFARRLMQVIADHGGDLAHLTMELTESAAMQQADGVLAMLEQVRDAGLQLAIDDFGAHHSSLARLRDLPVDILKIDRSFLRRVPEDPQANAIIGAILGLADALGLHAIAEGIETEEQHAALAQRGCRLGQGFLMARPLPEADVIALLQRPLAHDLAA